MESTNSTNQKISTYLKFKKVFEHQNMKNAEVSVAYKLNARVDNINELQNSYICVYFPTRDETNLPFLIHGSFETAVSREKLMSPSSFNDDLFDKLGDLIAESMKELAKKKLITQAFLRKSIIAAFKDEEENKTIPGLKEKVTDIISKYGLLPDKNGTYRKPIEMQIPVPFRLGDFVDKPLFYNTMEDTIFVAFNNENETNFNLYFCWLLDDLGMKLFKLSDFAERLRYHKMKADHISEECIKTLCIFYNFLSDYRESIYNTGLSYTRSGPYENIIRNDLKHAWITLRQSPIILNRLNKLVPAEFDKKPAIYLSSSSEYKNVVRSKLVDINIAESYKVVLEDGFNIQEFNNFQYVKEKIIKKYIEIDRCIGFENPDAFTREYVDDLKQIFALNKQQDVTEIQKLLKKAYIIKIKPQNDEKTIYFGCPGECYVPISKEHIDLDLYYSPFPKNELKDTDKFSHRNNHVFNLNAIDTKFYEENGIEITLLSNLGLISSPVDEGRRSCSVGYGDNYWVAEGEYCPELKIEFLEENLNYIAECYEDKLAQLKSAEILKLLLVIANKLQGKKSLGRRHCHISELESADILTKVILEYKWLYDKELKIHKSNEMSYFDLNTNIYRDITLNKTAFSILGFVEKEADEVNDTFRMASNLNKQNKLILFQRLAKEFRFHVSEENLIGDDPNDDESEDDFFDPNTWRDTSFPLRKIKNLEYLINHVQQQFYFADPITYKTVLRSIRISKNANFDRSYSIGMYTNSSNLIFCQMCKNPNRFIDVVQIANFGIEMPQLNLCLCRECSAKYHAMCNKNKENFVKDFVNELEKYDIHNSEDCSIKFNKEITLHFTHVHIAEIQEIFRLIKEYGLPNKD